MSVSPPARYTRRMRTPVLVLFSLAVTTALFAQEKPVGKDEVRVQVPGCAYNRTFITGSSPAGEPVGEIKEGRRLKLNASKDVLADIKKQTPSMIEVTGRIRKADLQDLRGISLGGGVRVGGGPPQASSSAGRPDLGYYEVIIDVESFRLLPDTCPKR